MKKALFLLIILTLTSCASYQISTLNHDSIYSIDGSDVEIVVIDNEQQLRNKLRTDFNFRYDFAQYALRQPLSFDWRFNRFNRGYNQYSIFGTNTWGYGSYWNRDMMWMDWVWGYPFGNGMGWSYSWNNQRWSSNQWGWNNPYGWNNYYGWGNGYGWNNGFYNRYRGTNVAYHNGRRGSTMTIRDRIGQSSMIQSTKRTNTRPRTIRSSETRIINTNNNDKTIRTNPRIYQRPESSGNGGRSRIGEVTPIKPIVPRQPRTIQPGQVRGRSQSSVPQQIRTSSSTNQQGRSSSSRKKN